MNAILFRRTHFFTGAFVHNTRTFIELPDVICRIHLCPLLRFFLFKSFFRHLFSRERMCATISSPTLLTLELFSFCFYNGLPMPAISPCKDRRAKDSVPYTAEHAARTLVRTKLYSSPSSIESRVQIG